MFLSRGLLLIRSFLSRHESGSTSRGHETHKRGNCFANFKTCTKQDENARMLLLKRQLAFAADSSFLSLSSPPRTTREEEAPPIIPVGRLKCAVCLRSYLAHENERSCAAFHRNLCSIATTSFELLLCFTLLGAHADAYGYDRNA